MVGMSRLFWICLGGALGTGARYLVSLWVLRTLGPAFPYGTLIVNGAGSFLIGAVMHVGLTTDLLSPSLRLVLEQMMVRIFVGEDDRWRQQPLATALVERLRKEGFAGATVLRGLAGFGARSVFHTSHLLELSQDLPLVIEVVDTEEHVQKLIPILDEMVSDGLVTLEKVRVLKYAPGTKR